MEQVEQPVAGEVAAAGVGADALVARHAAAGGAAELVDLALAAIPQPLAQRGIPTSQQLAARFRSMRSTVLALAALPSPCSPPPPPASQQPGEAAPGSHRPGPVAHALAQLAAWLKLDESVPLTVLGPEQALSRGGMDAALALTAAHLDAGRLAAAAEVLASATKGTAAAGAVMAWCDEARARETAEQALKLLRAHATALASVSS